MSLPQSRAYDPLRDEFFTTSDGRLGIRRIPGAPPTPPGGSATARSNVTIMTLPSQPRRDERHAFEDDEDDDDVWDEQVEYVGLGGFAGLSDREDDDMELDEEDEEAQGVGLGGDRDDELDSDDEEDMGLGHRDFEEELDYRGDAHDSGFRAPRIAPRWRFLRAFITLVEGRFAPQAPRRLHTDDVRLGREMNDWWINVQYENAMFVSRYDQLANNQVRRYRTVRDATLLLGVLARVDYVAFLALLMRRGKYDAPTHIDLDNHQLPARFNFFFCHDLEPKDYSWEVLQDVFGEKNYNQEFATNLHAVHKIARALDKKRRVTDDATSRVKRLTKPVTIKMTFRPDSTTIKNQVAILTNITKTVMEMQQIEASRAQTTHAATVDTISPPVFHLDHIELDLRQFTMDADVMQALAMLLKTGVRIASLTVPSDPHEQPTDSKMQKLQLAWASFILIALGVRPLSSQRLVCVDRLVLPSVYVLDLYMTPFMSALRFTTTLKSLRIEADPWMEDDSDRQRRLWLGLGYSLFSVSSSHSVEALDLSGHQLTDEALSAFEHMMSAEDPNYHWMLEKSRSNLTHDGNTVDYPLGRIKKGVSVNVVTSESCGPLKLPTSFVGQVLLVEDGIAIMLVPGLGFVSVNQSHVTGVSGHPARAVPPKRVKKLIFDASPTRRLYGRQQRPVPTRQFIPRLIEMVGSSVRSLAVHANDFDNACFQALIESCPRLEDLRIDSSSLKSLRSLIRAYDQGVGARPSSLDLRGAAIPKGDVDALLDRLGQKNHPAYHRLHRLAIGKGWSTKFDPSTDSRLDAMLANNRLLSHLYVYAGVESGWHPRNNSHNGERIAGSQSPRFAFLSVLRHRGLSGSSAAGACLGDDLARRIFEFVKTPIYRVAVRDFGSGLDDEEDMFF